MLCILQGPKSAFLNPPQPSTRTYQVHEEYRPGPWRAKQQMHLSQQSFNSKQGWFCMWGDFHTQTDFPDCQILPANIPRDGVSLLCVSTWDAMSPDQLPASWGATQLASQGWQAKATQWDGTCLALELPVPLPWAQRQQRLGFWFCFVRWVYLCSWVSLALDASFAHPFPRLLLCSLALIPSLRLSRRSATCFVSQKSSSW